MKEQVAVKRPTSRGIRRDGDGQSLGRLNDDGVLARQVFAGSIFKMHPHAVKMQRMLHHRVVHKGEAHPLAVSEVDRLFGF